MRVTTRRLLAILAVFGLIIAACGDDDDTGTDDPVEDSDGGTTADDSGDSGDSGDETTDDMDDEEAAPVTVTLADYAFPDIPASVEAGTTFTVNNVSETELHEFVAIRLPDDETRSVEELFQLPQEELEAIIGPGVQTVLLQAPGSPDVIPAVGDGTLSEPGRYAIACFIPVGAPPEEYFAAAEAAPEGEAPQLEGYGPPHFTQGMLAELVVE